MTKQHRATPEQWESIERYADSSDPYSCFLELRARIEALEACCKWVRSMFGGNSTWAYELRAARRPKPPSLRKQAYDALDTYIYGEPDPKGKERTYNTIRRALEALPND